MIRNRPYRKLAAALLFFVAIGLLGYALTPGAIDPAPESVLPARTAVMLDLSNPESHARRFIKTPLGSRLLGMDWIRILTALNVPVDTAEVSLADDLDKTLNSQWFKELFGRKAILSWLPTRQSSALFQDQLVVLARPRHRPTVVRWITRLFSTPAAPGIRSFSADPARPVFGAWSRGWFIAATALEPIRFCLDTANGDIPPLAGIDGFRDLKTDLAETADIAFGYAAVEQLSPHFSRHTPRGPSATRPVPETHEKINSNTPSVAWAVRETAGGIHVRMLSHRAPSSLREPDRRQHATASSGGPDTVLSMAPAHSLAVFWAGNLGQKWLPGWLHSLLGPRVADVDRWIRANTGETMERIARVVGPEAGWLLTDMGASSWIPVPDLALFFQVKNPVETSAVLENLLRASGQKTRTEPVNTQSIRYVRFPWPVGIEPGYAMVNGYCLVASDRRILRNMLHTLHAGNGLKTSADVRSALPPVSNRSIRVAFVQTGRLAGQLEATLKTLLPLASMQIDDKAGTLPLLSNELFRPILDELKSAGPTGLTVVETRYGYQADLYLLESLE